MCVITDVFALYSVIENHGDPDVNANGIHLLKYCYNNRLCITKTFFIEVYSLC